MSNSSDEESLSLEQRHRKEKKELQAQIQALKKAAKNDKTKKKELASEIMRLETDMEERHKKEIELLEDIDYKTENLEVEVDEETREAEFERDNKPKVSKAQKRRDKKHQQEKRRELEIKLQEQNDLYGPRNLEFQAICSRLKDRKLKMYSVPSDGDCLYNSIAHQLKTKHNRIISVVNLRKCAADYMLENKNDFMPFMTNHETNEMLTDAEFEKYCDTLRNTNFWGSQLEIRALSNSLKCPIIVVQATGPEAIEQGTEFSGPPLIISFHRYMYLLGEHYNSTEDIIIEEA